MSANQENIDKLKASLEDIKSTAKEGVANPHRAAVCLCSAVVEICEAVEWFIVEAEKER